MRNSKPILITGDIIVLAVITIIGFASHGETELVPSFRACSLLLSRWLLAGS